VSLEAIAEDLDLDLWVLGEVQVPRRRLVGSAFRGDDGERLAVGRVDQRRRALLAGLAPRRRQQQGLGALPLMPLGTVRCPVAIDVFLAEQFDGTDGTEGRGRSS
jgi:hypothetical protein